MPLFTTANSIYQVVASVPADLFMATKTENDTNGAPVYVGFAAPGAGSLTAVWAIKKYTTTGGSLVEAFWVNGDSSFAYAWGSRTQYTYS